MTAIETDEGRYFFFFKEKLTLARFTFKYLTHIPLKNRKKRIFKK